MFEVTTESISGNVYSVTADSAGEMLDRVRYATQSVYTKSVTVTPLDI